MEVETKGIEQDQEIHCPSCEAVINIDSNDDNIVRCNACGEEFEIAGCCFCNKLLSKDCIVRNADGLFCIDHLSPMQVITGVCPSKSNSYKIVTISGHGSLARTDALKDYEKSFYLQCNEYRNRNITDLIEFYIDVYYPSNRSDLDNSLKIVLDCLQACKAIKNDNQVVKIVAQKFVDKDRPRIEFEIKPIKY